MSFLKVIRNYMQQNETSNRLAKLAGPAAIGLSLGMPLVGCGGSDTIDENTLAATKGDEAQETAKTCKTNHDCSPGSHCVKKIKVVGHCPKGAYCIVGPRPVEVQECEDNAACDIIDECDENQVCLGGQGEVYAQSSDGKADKLTSPTPIISIYPVYAPPTTKEGTCVNTCETDNDCAIGEVCDKNSDITSGGCPEGALCILPPLPTKGICQMKIMPVFAPIEECTSNKQCQEMGKGNACVAGECVIAIFAPTDK